MLDTLPCRNIVRVEPQDERKKFELRLGYLSVVTKTVQDFVKSHPFVFLTRSSPNSAHYYKKYSHNVAYLHMVSPKCYILISVNGNILYVVRNTIRQIGAGARSLMTIN